VNPLKVLTDMGLKVPGDIALAGFADNPLSWYLHPGLTSVAQPNFPWGKMQRNC
jgi:DNA-binding LacI/PurR family transcriptional regulator